MTGLRPGEKLHEELITREEGIVRTEHKKIMVLKLNTHFKGFSDHAAFKQWLFNEVDALSNLTDGKDTSVIKAKLKEMVPDYTPDEKDFGVLSC